ncbi:MAG: type II toxin-antitoxin system RelE/ParE family toxin [Verrucomicrobiota bacterium]
MAELIWTEPALAELDEIADYIALDNPDAAKRLVRRVFEHVEQLMDHPESGSIPPELLPAKAYRQIVEPPCRIFYRIEDVKIFVVHMMRSERLLRQRNLER